MKPDDCGFRIVNFEFEKPLAIELTVRLVVVIIVTLMVAVVGRGQDYQRPYKYKRLSLVRDTVKPNYPRLRYRDQFWYIARNESLLIDVQHAAVDEGANEPRNTHVVSGFQIKNGKKAGRKWQFQNIADTGEVIQGLYLTYFALDVVHWNDCYTLTDGRHIGTFSSLVYDSLLSCLILYSSAHERAAGNSIEGVRYDTLRLVRNNEIVSTVLITSDSTDDLYWSAELKVISHRDTGPVKDVQTLELTLGLDVDKKLYIPFNSTGFIEAKAIFPKEIHIRRTQRM